MATLWHLPVATADAALAALARCRTIPRPFVPRAIASDSGSITLLEDPPHVEVWLALRALGAVEVGRIDGAQRALPEGPPGPPPERPDWMRPTVIRLGPRCKRCGNPAELWRRVCNRCRAEAIRAGRQRQLAADRRFLQERGHL